MEYSYMCKIATYMIQMPIVKIEREEKKEENMKIN